MRDWWHSGEEHHIGCDLYDCRDQAPHLCKQASPKSLLFFPKRYFTILQCLQCCILESDCCRPVCPRRLLTLGQQVEKTGAAGHGGTGRRWDDKCVVSLSSGSRLRQAWRHRLSAGSPQRISGKNGCVEGWNERSKKRVDRENTK